MIDIKNEKKNWDQKTYIIGFALDVSGCMKSSIRNSEGGSLAKLESLRESLDILFKEAERLLDAGHPNMLKSKVKFFAYAYGLILPGKIKYVTYFD